MSQEIDYKILYEKLKDDYLKLKIEKEELVEKLNTYTSTHRQRKYYEKNAEDIKQKNKEYISRLKEKEPSKIKEWNRTAYLKRKDKLKEERDTKSHRKD